MKAKKPYKVWKIFKEKAAIKNQRKALKSAEAPTKIVGGMAGKLAGKNGGKIRRSPKKKTAGKNGSAENVTADPKGRKIYLLHHNIIQ